MKRESFGRWQIASDFAMISGNQGHLPPYQGALFRGLIADKDTPSPPLIAAPSAAGKWEEIDDAYTLLGPEKRVFWGTGRLTMISPEFLETMDRPSPFKDALF